jgi:O-antigen ligase
MRLVSHQKIDRGVLLQYAAVIGGSFLFGAFILYAFKTLSSTYAVFVSAAAISPFIIFILGNAKRFLLGLLTILLPIKVATTLGITEHLGGAGGFVVSVFDMVLLALYLLWIMEMAREKRTKIGFFPALSIPFIILITISFLSMSNARHVDFSVYEIIEVLKMYLCFVYLANAVKDKSDVSFLVALLIVGLLFEGILGIAQHIFGRPFFPTSLGGPRMIDSRVSGSWISYNDFAWYLSFIMPLALSILFSKISLIYEYISGLALFAGGAALLWTGSRGGWISFAVACVFVVLFAFSRLRLKTTMIKTYVLILAVVILISPAYPRLTSRIVDRFTSDDNGSAESRLPQYQVAFNIIKDNPFLGVGINNYSERMADYDDTEEGLQEITRYPVHNIYLHIAAEQGIFGLAAFLLCLAAIFAKGLNYSFNHDGFMAHVVAGLLAGIVAFLIHGLADTASIGSKMFMFVWFFAGTIFAIDKVDSKKMQP